MELDKCDHGTDAEEVRNDISAFIYVQKRQALDGFLGNASLSCLNLVEVRRLIDVPPLESSSIDLTSLNRFYCSSCKKCYTFSGPSHILRHVQAQHPTLVKPPPGQMTITVERRNVQVVHPDGQVMQLSRDHLFQAAALQWTGMSYSQWGQLFHLDIVRTIKDSGVLGPDSMRGNYLDALVLRGKQLIRNAVSNVRYSLMFDESTKHARKFMDIIILVMTDDGLQPLLLMAKKLDSTEVHDAIFLGEVVSSTLGEFGLSLDRCHSVVTDNGGATARARKNICNLYPHVIDMPCIAHGLHLVVSRLLVPKQGKQRPFDAVYEATDLARAFFHGRGHCDARRARARAFDPGLDALVSALDFVPTRWGSLLTAVHRLRQHRLVLLRFLNVLHLEADFLVPSRREAALVRIVALERLLSDNLVAVQVSLVLALLREVPSLIQLVQKNELSGHDSRAIVSDGERCYSRCARFSQHPGEAEAFISDLLPPFGVITQDEKEDLVESLIEACGAVKKKMEKRLLNGLWVVKLKMLFDPYQLVELVGSGLLKEWNDSGEWKVSGRWDQGMDERSSFPCRILGPYLEKLISLKLISNSRALEVRQDYEFYLKDATNWIESSKDKGGSPPAPHALLAEDDCEDVELVKRPEKRPRGDQPERDYWKDRADVAGSRFSTMLRMAMASQLLTASSSEVERRFSSLRTILSDSRKGVISDATVEKEAFVRGNKDFFKKNRVDFF